MNQINIPKRTTGFTNRQRKQIEAFLHLFSDVESALKARLRRRANDPTGIRVLIGDYVAKNPYWTDTANRLRNLAEIRNLLTHQRSTTAGYPIAVAPCSLVTFQEIYEHLCKPELVAIRYRKQVQTVSNEDSLASVLTCAFEHGFSQFPVVNEGRFGGLITENEIIRWLGRRTKAQAYEVNLAGATVKMVLKEKDPFLRGIPIFHFQSLNAGVGEVMGLFATEPALEAILLTENGHKDTPLEGIVTQWDAARYRP